MQRSLAVQRDIVVLVAGVIAVPLVFLVGATDDGPPVDPISAMNADAARHLRDVGAVAPTQLPPYFTQVWTSSVYPVGDARRLETTQYQSGGVSVTVCEAGESTPADLSPCTSGPFKPVLQQVTVGARTVTVTTDPGWVVPASEADIPEGDLIAEILWWWVNAPLGDAAATSWVADLAAEPGMSVLTEQ